MQKSIAIISSALLALGFAAVEAKPVKPKPKPKPAATGVSASKGVWSNSVAGCGALKAYEKKHGRMSDSEVTGGLNGSDSSFAVIRGSKVSWFESSCKIGARSVKNGVTSHPLTCSGEGVKWTATMRVITSTRIRFIGDAPTSGPHVYCRS